MKQEEASFEILNNLLKQFFELLGQLLETYTDLKQVTEDHFHKYIRTNHHQNFTEKSLK